MKLIKCEIQNFGKLNNFSFDFQDGVNTINEENGFGKTTLAIFIKTMFYGFKSTKTKKISENERIKYMPWNGLKCAGSLSFEYKGEKFEIQRSFGKTAAGDTVRIISLDTNKETKVFSNPKEIGLEIFGVDAASYEKSSFFPQLGNDDFKISDDIRKKFTDILETSGDSLGFDAALKRLEDKQKEYASVRGKGLINELDNEINTLEKRLIELNGKYDSLDELNNELNAINENLFDSKERISQIEITLDKYYESKRLMEIKDGLQVRKDKIESLQKAIELLESKKIPSEEEIISIQENIKKINEVTNAVNNLSEKSEIEELDSLNKLYSDTDRLEEIIEKVNNYNSLVTVQTNDEIRVRYENLKKIFDNNELNEEELKTVKKDIDKLNNKLLFKLMIIMSIPISIIFGIIKVLFHIERWEILAITCICLLTIYLVFSFVLNNKIYKRELTNKVKSFFNKYNINEKDYETSLIVLNESWNKYLEYKKIVEKDLELNSNNSEVKEELTKELREIFNSYEIFEEDFTTALARYKINLKRIVELTDKVKDIKSKIVKLTDEKNSLIILVDKELERFNINASDLNSALEVLKSRKRDLDTFNKNLIEAIEDKNKYIAEKKIVDGMFDNLVITDDTNLQEEKKETQKVVERKVSEKANLENKIQSIMNECEEISEISDLINEKKVLIKEYKDKFDILDLTIKYLNKAKENLTSSYLKPMEKSFKKYIALLDETFENAIITEDFAIEAKRYGENKTIEYFSQGYQDLLYICIRLALVENLYKDEKPVLVLDDPFVNLDEKKINKALELLETISKEYQIIYLVCHNSRA